jgi:hypothetical protein
MELRENLVSFAKESLGLPHNAPCELLEFEGRGSDRAYYRFRWGPDSSAILVHYQTSRIENTYYAEIARFLQANSIPVPQIYRHDPACCFILMKDLGDTDLWSLRDLSWELRRSLYQKTLRIVHRLHSHPEALFPSGEVRLMDAFGPSLYRWERDYFKENFVGTLCSIQIDPVFSSRLEAELDGLASRFVMDQRCLVHRDLQSQNVMICDHEPFLIDFQGMRFGSRFYDLGSLLCDPYVRLSPEERKNLLAFYYGLSEPDRDWNQFQNAFWEASAQRLMQALGAYGFLGISRGLKSYLTHVPAAIRNLHAAAENAGSLPMLLELTAMCESIVSDSKAEIPNEHSTRGAVGIRKPPGWGL